MAPLLLVDQVCQLTTHYHLGRQAFHNHRNTLRLAAAWELGAGWCSNCSAGHLCSSEEHHLAPPSTQVSPGLLNPSPTFSRRDTGRLWVTHTDPQSILMYIYCGYCGGSSTSSTLHLLSTSPPSSLSQVFPLCNLFLICVDLLALYIILQTL